MVVRSAIPWLLSWGCQSRSVYRTAPNIWPPTGARCLRWLSFIVWAAVAVVELMAAEPGAVAEALAVAQLVLQCLGEAASMFLDFRLVPGSAATAPWEAAGTAEVERL